MVLWLGVAAAGCGDDGPTTPSGLPLVFSAPLSPANEVPAIANAEASGRGAVQITMNVTRDSSNVITGGTVTFHVQLAGFPNDTSPTAAHIHNAAAGVNGPIVVDTGLLASTGLAFSDGTATFTARDVSANAAVINAIVANPANYYFNIHSRLNPAGFARGQLSRVQ
jgi:hypothetical protein